MEFFLPGSEHDPYATEVEYAALAALVGCPVPAPADRVYSMQFVHEGDTWTATVGHPWRGEHVHREQHDGDMVDVVDRLPCCSAVVLAIFPGEAHVVVTEAFPLSDTRCVWRNPLTTRDATSIELFAHTT